LAFERNLISSRQRCSSQGGHYVPEIGRSSLRISEAYSPDLALSDYYLFPNLFIKPKAYQPPCISSIKKNTEFLNDASKKTGAEANILN
jgi:hypothetical protein